MLYEKKKLKHRYMFLFNDIVLITQKDSNEKYVSELITHNIDLFSTTVFNLSHSTSQVRTPALLKLFNCTYFTHRDAEPLILLV